MIVSIKYEKLHDSLSKILACEAKKILRPSEICFFDGSILSSLFIFQRYLNSNIYPIPYTVIETSFFKKCKQQAEDVEIIEKIERLKSLLRTGDQAVNNPKMPAKERFITQNSVGYYDKDGRFVSDFLADIVGVRHFHVGYNKKTNDNLIFIRFEGCTAYLLALGTHKDIHVDSGHSIVFDALSTEFSSELNRFFPELKGIHPSMPPLSKEENVEKAKILKSAGVTSFFTDPDGRVRLFGLGLTTARTPATINHFSNSLMAELYEGLRNLDDLWFENPLKIINVEKMDSLPKLIFCQRDDKNVLKITAIGLEEKGNLAKLVNILESIYFIKGEKRRSIGEFFRKKYACHTGEL